MAPAVSTRAMPDAPWLTAIHWPSGDGRGAEPPVTTTTSPEPSAELMRPGTRVRHPLFGVGTVLRREGDGDDRCSGAEGDDDGDRVEHAGFETTMQSERQTGFAYFFELPEGADIGGYAWVYRTPAGIVQLPVEYELEDIPLP